MTITTELAAGAIFAVMALWCFNHKRGVEKWVYTALLGSVALTLAWPAFPTAALEFFGGVSLSGAGYDLFTAACVLAVPVIGLLYICNLPVKKKSKKRRGR